ncbi:hypothetical protein ACWD4F_16895 [Streptomyces aureus]
MRTNKIIAARTATFAVGAILATGCGVGNGPADPVAATAPARSAASGPFDQNAVRSELQAAVTAAGLSGGEVKTGYEESRKPHAPAGTAKARKAAALATKLAPCVVTWWPTGKEHRSPHSTDPAAGRRQLKAVLASLAARGWKVSTPPKEGPLGDNGTYFMVSYKKRGWLLYARNYTAPVLDQVTLMATELACFARLTDEEQALIDSDAP